MCFVCTALAEELKDCPMVEDLFLLAQSLHLVMGEENNHSPPSEVEKLGFRACHPHLSSPVPSIGGLGQPTPIRPPPRPTATPTPA